LAAGQSPLAQFEIKRLVPMQIGDIDISFTNSSAFMVLAVMTATAVIVLGMRKHAVVPGRWQSIAELSYLFVANMVRDTVGSEGRRYFPLIFTLFLFVLCGNMLGMIPYGFTYTSHVIVTFTMASVIFVGVTAIGFIKHGIRFFGIFLPPGTPILMAPLAVPIEIISYFSRPISLSVRLFANMLAGHTLMKVFAGFIVSLGYFGFVPFAFVFALTGLELLIAFLQAYVFTVLTCLYLHDALHMH
jgi:F-type H+-transporting ATPase subunit a